MNYIKSDKGEMVLAVGAPASLARVRVQYPALLEHLSIFRSPIARRMAIRHAGIKSILETDNILLAAVLPKEN